ncbi:MAG: AAA family ATPase [Clostridia bacterium]|nr:AAA family ATPase [Clostridia bacterium]
MQYGLIGEKLSHSFSKEIHESLASYTYELCEIARENLAEFLKRREFCAINVTMPYKKEVIPHLDEVSTVAGELQAVNCIVNKDGKLYGYNTDYFGMRDLILRSGIDLSGKKVLILGTGGTSRTSTLVCKDLGANEIIKVSRSKNNNTVTYDEAYEKHFNADVIINTTPVGMYPDCCNSPIDLNNFSNLQAVFDAVYNPLRTQLVIDAKSKGVHAEGGLYMLVSQAVHAVELFINEEFEESKTNEIFNKIANEKENIVLIGMPSCGKTTVGKILAEKLHREFIDLDDEIVKIIGCEIAEFFKAHTEKDFRDIETQITKENSKKNGVIIATGGGCVLRNENANALRQNGRLYFLDRDLSNLTPTDSRPLATKKEALEKLYKERYGIYVSSCDCRIDGNLTPSAEADLIEKEFLQK